MIAPGPSGIRVRVRHVRRAGACAAGLRAWFAAHGREVYQQFRDEGLPVEWVEAQDDAFAARAAQAARQEADNDGQ